MSKTRLISIVLVVLMCLSLCSCRDKYGNWTLFSKDKDEYNFGGESGQTVDSTEPESETESQAPNIPQYTITYKTDTGKTSLMDSSETIALCNVDINIPVFTIAGHDDAAKEINNYFGNYAYQLSMTAKDFAKTAQTEYYDCLENKGTFVPYDLGLTYEVIRTDNIISVVCSYSEYTGGVHPTTMKTGYNFLTETGKKLELKDIVTNDGFSDFAFDYIKNTIKNGDYETFDDYDDTLRTIVTGEMWYLSQEGMVFISNPYELQPFASGIYTFTIPYADAKPYLAGWVIK